MRLVALVVALGVAGLASAHTETVHERAVLQFKPTATGLLYELNFPAGPAAAHWRLRFDLNHDGRISEQEYGLLAKGLAQAVAAGVRLSLEGQPLPWKVVDAQVTPSASVDRFSGKIAALVLLETRALPPGLRRVELDVTPVVDPARVAVVRVEPDLSRLDSIVGGRPGGRDALGETILVGRRDHVTLHVDVPKTPGK